MRIAVLDSGIRWRDPGSMADLATKAYINLGEAQPPCWPAVADGDCNHDGVFNITDFGAIPDLNHNGVADPEDLILNPAYSNGHDDDHDGYVDDISGWDFLYGDNDPLDTVDYGHGTGEAKDSSAAANGTGDVGTCPGCLFIPVRVGDSFIADGGRFAAGVLFGLDSGADVIQEALGGLNDPRQAQEAIDAAYHRGVVVVASMADEASKHPNLPGLARAHDGRELGDDADEQPARAAAPPTGYLALNGCTNFGGHTFVSVPVEQLLVRGDGRVGRHGRPDRELRARSSASPPNPALTSWKPGDNVLSADEAMQVVRSTADDIDFSTPNAVDPANNFGTPNGSPILDTVRYPTHRGLGRHVRLRPRQRLRDAEGRARRAHPARGDDRQPVVVRRAAGPPAPPRSPVGSPRRGPAPTTTGSSGRRDSSRPLYPATDHWTVAATHTGLTAPVSGTLATLDLASIAASLPDGGQGAPVDTTDQNRPDEERFSVRIRVVVTAHGGAGDGLQGEMQKQVFVHDDPDLVGWRADEDPGREHVEPALRRPRSTTVTRNCCSPRATARSTPSDRT